MPSQYPPSVIRQVLDGLEALDVLELIDYYPGSMARANGKIRCLNPLTREEEGDGSMVVDELTKTYQILQPGWVPDGNNNLIELYSRCRNVTFDDALVRLAEEFDIEIYLPENQDAIDEDLLQASAYLQQVRADPAKQVDYAREAQARLDRVLSIQPDHARALRLLVELKAATGATGDLGELAEQLADAELRVGNEVGYIQALSEELERNPQNRRLRRLLAEHLLHRERLEDAAQHLMLLADSAEEAGDLEEALWAYRQMARQNLGNIDPRPMIAQLLVSLGREGELLEEYLSQARDLEDQGDLAAASEALELASDLEPRNGLLAHRYVDLQVRRGLKGDGLEKSLHLLRRLRGVKEAQRDVLEALVALLRLRPDNQDLLSLVVESYELLGRVDLANEARQRQVDLYRRSKKYKDALGTLEAMLEADPKATAARRLRAQVAGEMGDQEGQERYLAEALKDTPDDLDLAEEHAALLIKLGRGSEAHAERLRTNKLLLDRGEAEKAEPGLQALVAADAQSLEGWELLLRAQETLNQPAEARRSRLKIIEITGERNDRLKFLAALDGLIRGGTLTLEEAQQAETALRKVLRREPHQADLHKRLIALLRSAGRHKDADAQIMALIEALEESKQYDEAERLYRGLLKRSPNDAVTRSQFVDLLRRLDKREEAVKELLTLADTFERVGTNPEAAIGVLQDALTLDPANGEARNALRRLARDSGTTRDLVGKMRDVARLHIAENQFKEGRKTLEEAVELEPDSIPLRRQLVDLLLLDKINDRPTAVRHLDMIASLHERAGDVEAAFTARREAVALRPEDIQRRRQLVEDLAEAGRREAALEETLTLAEHHRSLGEYDEALESLEAALELEQNHIEARRARAEIYEETGQVQAALREWRTLAPLLELKTEQNGGKLRPTPLMILPEYDFENFIVGDHNRFAWATGQAVARSPGNTPHNPLFLHADVGLGKTHILHAIANYVRQHHTDMRLLYTTAEDFTSELVDAIQNNAVTAFRQRHKAADVLLLDDAHLLSGKERSQEEFFHLFNTLYQAKKQIVVTSDRPPKEIAHLEKRLLSRFGAGVIVEIQPPELETRVAILKRTAQERGVEVGSEVLTLLAEMVATNVRELKAAFNQLVLQHEIGGEPMTVENARRIVEKLVPAAS